MVQETTIDAINMDTKHAPRDTNTSMTSIDLQAYLQTLCLAVFLVGLINRTIITTTIPKIANEFNSLDDIGWYGSAYLLTSCSFQLMYGKMYSYISVKWTFLGAIGLFEAGSALCGAAQNSDMLIIGRALAGLGCAGIISGALVIISLSLPMHKRPIYTGLISAVNGVARVLDLYLGVCLQKKSHGGRWCFCINLPIGAVTLLVITFPFTDPPNKKAAAMTPAERRRQFDLFGTIFFVPAIGSWRVILLFVMARCLATLCLGAAFLLITYFLPLWFQAIKNTTATGPGVDYLPTAISVTFTSISAGFVTTAIGYYVPLMLGSSVSMSIGAGLMTTFTTSTSTDLWIGTQILFGAGAGMGIQQPMMAVQAVLSPIDIPIGITAIIFAQALGGAVFLSIGQSIFQNKLVQNLVELVPALDLEVVTENGAWGLRAKVESLGSQ
ncbi:MFS general substrate transporter [Acephala macrosclerotiorum]|nr:MFS general substrate transporter [Acephala macrosclerotiorum]